MGSSGTPPSPGPVGLLSSISLSALLSTSLSSCFASLTWIKIRVSQPGNPKSDHGTPWLHFSKASQDPQSFLGAPWSCHLLTLHLFVQFTAVLNKPSLTPQALHMQCALSPPCFSDLTPSQAQRLTSFLVSLRSLEALLVESSHWVT